MAPGDNDVDQDALAAEWEGALDPKIRPPPPKLKPIR
jgi:hypothetical protein